ncbi:MAG: hypothetical protein APF77_10275 [Clostridia bacterium BRH_c25]|nr:MAG: hypothetical protein APF77_10275 [Clostridia bacterium BRH_c25]
MRPDEQSFYYESIFAGHMAEFIRYKRAQGLKYTAVPLSLRSFSRFIAAKGTGEMALSKNLIEEWCRLRANENKLTQRRRIVETTQFLKYLAEKGIPIYLPRTTRKPRSQQAFTPYIFSPDELHWFFQKCDQLTARAPSSMPTMLPLIFRVLYGCGLRISEVLNLKYSDVDLDAGHLVIRKAKFNKDRMVPLSESLLRLFHNYSATAHRSSTDNDEYFFAHKDSRPVKADNVYSWYRKVLWAVGISHGGRGNGPRLHDFRHTFSVYAMKSMTDNGMDIYCALPILSTYLGHASVSATGQYVRLTQDMFPEIVSKVSTIAAFVIPGGDMI